MHGTSYFSSGVSAKYVVADIVVATPGIQPEYSWILFLPGSVRHTELTRASKNKTVLTIFQGLCSSHAPFPLDSHHSIR